jgi:hypothetical protein
MWATLAMTAALSFAPQQGKAVSFSNARFTYGILGGTRKDTNSPKFLPGDLVVLSFDMEGLKMGEDGRVLYALGTEVRDKNDKLLFRQEQQELESYYPQGGNRFPAFALTELGTDVQPGEYSITAIVSDRAEKGSQAKRLTKKFDVLAAQFGIVSPVLTFHERGLPAPPLLVPGQRVMVNYGVTGFQRDPKTKQPYVIGSMRILDENKKPTLEKEIRGDVKQYPENSKVIPISFHLLLNRPGKFTIEMKAKDEVAGKSATQTFDIEVVEPKVK